ncbi:hypothetical protein M4I33_03745 [Clostridium sp. LY3-2]|uniref:hypothetical protein n=1 Tax=Clostridium sp. LY3-2 TaxID=2942482 RepID=UPI0021521D15|nr:hypothetical protein [Clostridium sp. LY3-2]MCR6513989.1 hypothetical protein [Clostridium sp. LY3-2]
MNSYEYFKELDINEYFNEYRKEILQNENFSNYIIKNGDDNLRLFSEMFWEEPLYGIKNIKDELDIPNNISFSNIIKAYPCEKYICFLNEIYLDKIDMEKISKKYNIQINRIRDLLINPIINEVEKACPECLETKFQISLLNEKVEYICIHCKANLRMSDLLTETEKLNLIEEKRKKEEQFISEIEGIKNELEDTKCPKCQNELKILYALEKFQYKIKCSQCDYQNKKYELVIKEYKQWQKRAAMMIDIKASEDKIIKEVLKEKRIEDTKFKNVEIINKQESFVQINNWEKENKWNKDIVKEFDVLKQVIRGCCRLENNMLIKLIELANEKGEIRKLGCEYFVIYFDSPMVAEIMEFTGIIDVRSILRRLMHQDLLSANEEDNMILIPKVVVLKLDEIRGINKQQNIDPQLRFLAMSRQNFACSICGEVGKRLKIAYLTSNKKTLDLNEVIALCEDCFELLTVNEIVIDGTISSDIRASGMSRCMQFLVSYIPELENSTKMYEATEKMEEVYGAEEALKALAVTLYQVDNKKLDKAVDTVISYTYGILKNSKVDGGIVTMYETVYKKYRLDKFGISDICIK